jgi:Prolipoprotein diacylglyceryl transferase
MIGLLELFVFALFFLLMVLLSWASLGMPKERWQFIATVPQEKQFSGVGDALNFTWYGALTALAFVVSCALVIIMTGSIRISIEAVMLTLAFLIAVSLWSARAVAQWVEKIPGTHTIGGAVFVVVLLAPCVIHGVSALLHASLAYPPISTGQILALMSALAVAYAYGEGLGRIACISFGCCWGKRVDQLKGWQRWLFNRFHFVFQGHTKKIAYASQMAGVPVIPIQAITAAIHFVVGSIGLWLFLTGRFGAALIVTMSVTQLWRFGSEFLRADYRGSGRVTVYQWMALACVLLSLGYVWVLQTPADLLKLDVKPDLLLGLKALWSPSQMIALQLMGLLIFRLTGKSSVTRGSLRLSVVK